MPEGFALTLEAGAAVGAARGIARLRRTARSTGRTPSRSPSPRSSRDGIPIRLSGQDAERGTFSQRHLVLHDPTTDQTHTPLQALPGAKASFAVYNSPLSEQAVRRLRVRLQRAGAGPARALGGAVRRLRQWRPDHHRPVHRRRPLQVAAVPVAGDAAAAWLRGAGTGALQRPPRALPAALGAGQHPRRQLHDRRAVLPPAAAAGAAPGRRPAPADPDDAEEPAAQPAGFVRSGGSGERHLPAGPRRPTRRRGAGEGDRRVVLCSGKVAVDLVRPARCGRRRRTSRSSGSSSWRRSRTPRSAPSWRTTRTCASSSGSRKSRATWAPGASWSRGCASWSAVECPISYIGRPDRASPAEGSLDIHNEEQARIVEAAFADVPAQRQRSRRTASRAQRQRGTRSRTGARRFGEAQEIAELRTAR